MTASTDFEDRRRRLAWAASTLPQAIDESGASALPELDRVWTELAHLAEQSKTKHLRAGTVHGEDQGLAPSRRWAILLRSVQTRLDSFAARSANPEELEGLERACVRSLLTAATFLSLEVQELASPAVAPADTLAEERRRAGLRRNDHLAQELLHHAMTRSWRDFIDRYEAPSISSVTPLRPAVAPTDSAPGRGAAHAANAEPDPTARHPNSRSFPAARFLRAAWKTSPLSSSLVTLHRARAAGSSWVASYEMVIILEPSLDERTVAPSLEVFLNVIRNDGGTVENVDVWGRRRLAYEIEEHAEGIYAVLDIRCEPKTIKEVDRQLALNDSVLRTKVMRRDPTAAMDRGESGAN